jgi:hypothetical protein
MRQTTLMLIVAIALIAAATWWFMRKESYVTEYVPQTVFLDQPVLKPVLRSRNEETHDVLAYALGGM